MQFVFVVGVVWCCSGILFIVFLFVWWQWVQWVGGGFGIGVVVVYQVGGLLYGLWVDYCQVILGEGLLVYCYGGVVEFDGVYQ